MRKIIDFWKHFWLGVWRIVKQIGSIRGIIALICSWVVLSVVGIGFIGIVLKNGYLISLGGTIMAFWIAPFTPQKQWVHTSTEDWCPAVSAIYMSGAYGGVTQAQAALQSAYPATNYNVGYDAEVNDTSTNKCYMFQVQVV